jgi:PadR family transcriptional regulator, regulatory protein PadR
MLSVRSDENLQVEAGSLYPAPHRLDRRGGVVSDWGQTGQNQRAKFYRITAADRRQLECDRRKWATTPAAIAAIVDPLPES